MKSQAILTVLGATLAATAPSSFSPRTNDPLPENFYLQAIALGAPSGSYLTFLYNSYPHNYGVVGNGTGDFSEPAGLFSFDDASSRLTFNYQDQGTYESQAPGDGGSIVMEPDGTQFDANGELDTACDDSGAIYVVDSTYTGVNALDPWGLCHNPAYPEETRITYAPDTLPDFEGYDCTRVATRVETSA